MHSLISQEESINPETYWSDPFECTRDMLERKHKFTKEFQIRLKRNYHLQELLSGFYSDYLGCHESDHANVYSAEYYE